VPEGPPPEEVVSVDLKQGNGPVISKGDKFTVRFASFYYSTGKIRENFLGGESTFVYTYGVGETVRGWEDGLRGLRAGGARELIVPADQAYGDALVYLVRLLQIQAG
jgi:peptidylprolyl isomerase